MRKPSDFSEAFALFPGPECSGQDPYGRDRLESDPAGAELINGIKKPRIAPRYLLPLQDPEWSGQAPNLNPLINPAGAGL